MEKGAGVLYAIKFRRFKIMGLFHKFSKGGHMGI